jgi:hypothetical protein
MAGIDFDRDQVDLAVVHAALGAYRIGKLPHRLQFALEEDGFEAEVMIQVGVHGRHGEIVVRVLQADDALRQIALVVVEHIRQARNTVQARFAILMCALKLGTEQVAHRLGTVFIAAPRDPLIKLGGELVIERNGEALHGRAPCVSSRTSTGRRPRIRPVSPSWLRPFLVLPSSAPPFSRWSQRPPSSRAP